MTFWPVGDGWLQLELEVPELAELADLELTFPFPMWHQLNLWE